MEEEALAEPSANTSLWEEPWSVGERVVLHLVEVVVGAVWLVGGTFLGLELVIGVGFAWHGDTARHDPEPWSGFLWMALLGPLVGVGCWLVRYVGTTASRGGRRRFAWVATLVIATAWGAGVIYLIAY